jgi:hypothetical protein
MPGTIAQYLLLPLTVTVTARPNPAGGPGPGLDSIIGQGECVIKARRSRHTPERGKE